MSAKATSTSPFREFLSTPTRATTTFRYLLRDQLRECTYLPDPWLRSYYKQYILARYRSYRVETTLPLSFADRVASTFAEPTTAAAAADTGNGNSGATDPEKPRDNVWAPKPWLLKKSIRNSEERQVHLFKEARDELRMLARANLGHEKPLMRIMLRAYGRIGKRRYELLAPWMLPENPESTDELKAILVAQGGWHGMHGEGLDGSQPQDGKRDLDDKKEVPDGIPLSVRAIHNHKGAKPRPKVPALPSTIRALVTVQAMQPIAKTLTNVYLQPEIPKQNAWRRPFPANRARNIIRKWYLDLVTKLLPPLPAEEFDRLKALAAGQWEIARIAGSGREPTRIRTPPVYAQPPRRPLANRAAISGKRIRQVGTWHYDTPENLDRPCNLGPQDNKVELGTIPESEQGSAEELEYDPSHSEEDQNGGATLDLNSETSIPHGMLRTEGAHKLTARHMKRLWAKVLRLSCIMEHVNGKWQVHWGAGAPLWRELYKKAEKEGSAMPEDKAAGMQQESSAHAPISGGSGFKTTPVNKRGSGSAWMFVQ